MTPDEKKTLLEVRAHVSACSMIIRILAGQTERAGQLDRKHLLAQFDAAYLAMMEVSPQVEDAREMAIQVEQHFRAILGEMPSMR